jgi:hypothetical protein
MGTYDGRLRWGLLGLVVGLLGLVSPAGADFDKGCDEYKKGEYAKALQEWRLLAEQGDATAQFTLGVLYDTGEGVPQDYAQAMQWYRQAAAQGHAKAQFNLGVLYDTGKGVRQDYAQAMQWYRQAAAQGHAKAQNNLMVMYAAGQGVPQNYLQAHVWANLVAAQSRDPERKAAVETRDRIGARLTPAQLATAQARARAWQPTPVVTPSHVSAPSPHQTRIRQAQERLQASGFPPGAIDGAMGPQTQQALRRFQASQGLLATGNLDEKTLEVLGVP